MTALVTGGSGFIGTNLVELLRPQSDPVISLDVRPPQDPAHAVDFETLDVLDRAAMDDVIARVAPDVVYHLAARTDLQGTTVGAYRVNVDGTRNLVDSLEAAQFTGRLVMVSSMLVCRNGYEPEHPTDCGALRSRETLPRSFPAARFTVVALFRRERDRNHEIHP